MGHTLFRALAEGSGVDGRWQLDCQGQGDASGRVISPLLANLFLHSVFDVWLKTGFPGVPVERYADDIICHCHSKRQAAVLRTVLERRFAACGFMLHPEKTKIVYCKDTNRAGEFHIQQFDFLGYTFRPRLAQWRGTQYGVSFLPAASPSALKAIRQTVRGWSLKTRSDKALDDLARMFNPHIRGWISYYSHFYKSALYETFRRIDAHILRWAGRKFKRLRQMPKAARIWLARVIRTSLNLFTHWPLLYGNGRTLGAV